MASEGHGIHVAMRRHFALALLLCFIAIPGFAQSPLNGKWATDRPPDPLPETERRQSMQLDLSIDGAKASATVNIRGLGGEFFVLRDGVVTGNTVQFKTEIRPDSNEQLTWWTIEAVDENTVHVRRSTRALSLVGNNVLNLIALLPGAQPLTPSRTTIAAPAQATGAAPAAPIAGIVQDASQAFIPGVAITATNTQTGIVTTTITNESGAYNFTALNAGVYNVSAALPGFRTQTFDDVQFSPGTPVRLNFVLEVGVVIRTALPGGMPVVLHRVN